MTHAIAILHLLFCSGVARPSLGVAWTATGWKELLGIRGNFLWADAGNSGLAEEGPAWTAWRPETGELFLWDGSLLKVVGSGGTRTGALAGVRGEPMGIGFREGMLVALTRDEQLRLWEFEARTLEPRGSGVAGLARGAAAIDARGFLWTSSDGEVRCGGTQWEVEGTVTALDPMRDGWVIVRTSGEWYIARSGDPVLYLLPNP